MAKQPGEGVSPEMDEVMKDLREEGVDLEDQETDGETPEESEQDSQQGEDEAGSESEETEETSDEEDSEQSEESEDSSEESEEGDETREDVESSQGKSVPIGKLNYWKEKARKTAEELKKLRENSSRQEIDEKLKQISAEEGISMDRLQILVDAISSKVISPEMKQKIEMAAKHQEQVAYEEHQNNAFTNDFEATVRPIIMSDNPDITQQEYDQLFNEVYNKAFAPTKENTLDPKLGRAPKSLVDIYLESRKSPRRFGGERTRVRSLSGSGSASFEDVRTSEDVDNMSDEDFEKSFNQAKASSPKMIGKKMART